MSSRAATLLLGAILAGLVPGCRGSDNLFDFEIEFLREDVVDLYTIVFQGGENAYLGDRVEPEEVVDPPAAGNGFTVTYDLPAAPRVGLGFGSGRVRLSVREDGVPRADPLSFSFGTTSANEVVVSYALRYDGQTFRGRDTRVDFDFELAATRTGPSSFLVVYTVDGETSLGGTFCRLRTVFRAPGRPQDGIDGAFGDGSGVIDDPAVFDALDLDVDWFPDGFRAEGDVGCCGYLDVFIRYLEVL